MEGARVAASVCALLALGAVLSRHLQNLGRARAARGGAEPRGGADLGRRRLPARRHGVRDRRRARGACGRPARAAVPGLSDQRRGHDRERLRDHRHRRPRLDPGRAHRRPAARRRREPRRRPSSPRPIRTSTASCWCCWCCWCAPTACSANADGRPDGRSARHRGPDQALRRPCRQRRRRDARSRPARSAG